MIPEQKYVDIAKGLLEKTKMNQVPWKKQSRVAFDVKLPQSEISIVYGNPPTEPDFIRLLLIGQNGYAVGEWLVQEGEDNWPLAWELYCEASRYVTGWDKVLQDVEQFLASEVK